MSHTDPKYIGPGYWASFHRRSFFADMTKDNPTYEKIVERREMVAKSIVQDVENFPCFNCREHAINYLKQYPITDSIFKRDKNALFNWTVDFHNFVNNRIGKPIVTIEQATLLWSDDGKGTCFKNCGQNEDHVSGEDTIKRYLLLLNG